MKPVFATLRGKGHLSSGYLDDSFLVGYSYDECQSNINDTLKLLPNEDESVLKPTHVLQHLGFSDYLRGDKRPLGGYDYFA